MLAATASTRSTPLWRSNTTGSPVWASTAVMSTVRSGQCWLGSRAATVARHCVCPEPSDAASISSAAAPILRRMSAGFSAAAMIPLVLSMWSADGPNGTRPPSDPTGPVRCWGAAERMSASSWVGARAGYLGRGRRSGRRADDQIGIGHIQPGIEQACDDADQPRIACRSATTEDQRSLTRGAYPLCGVDLRLILVGPRQVEAVVEMECRGEEGVVFMGVAFRELPGGRSRWRLTQSRDRGLQGSTQCGYCVHGSHLLPTGHDHLDASTTGALRSRHHAGCRVAVERVDDRYTLICDGPPKCRPLHGHDYRRPASHQKKASHPPVVSRRLPWHQHQ